MQVSPDLGSCRHCGRGPVHVSAQWCPHCGGVAPHVRMPPARNWRPLLAILGLAAVLIAGVAALYFVGR